MTTILLRRGTSAQWSTTNPVLSTGEQGFETDTGRFKIGNGSTRWESLPYYVATPDVQDIVSSTLAEEGVVSSPDIGSMRVLTHEEYLDIDREPDCLYLIVESNEAG